MKQRRKINLNYKKETESIVKSIILKQILIFNNIYLISKLTKQPHVHANNFCLIMIPNIIKS